MKLKRGPNTYRHSTVGPNSQHRDERNARKWQKYLDCRRSAGIVDWPMEERVDMDRRSILEIHGCLRTNSAIVTVSANEDCKRRENT